MYNNQIICQLIDYLMSVQGEYKKDKLSSAVQDKFNLTKKRSVLYGEWFAITFSTSKNDSPYFNNVILSLSTLKKYDHLPFIVCLVTPSKNYVFLANTTFLKKISHSSQKLRVDNIRGSFLGNDIERTYEELTNEPENFESLFLIHESYSFEDNLTRLVESTNNITPKGKKFQPTTKQRECIISSVNRAILFMNSEEYTMLKNDLNARVKLVEEEIKIASSNNNVNLRGRIIEFLITDESNVKEELTKSLQHNLPLPEIYTADNLGDYECTFPKYATATDIKSKMMFLSSNPKGYNVDKLLSFLATENSVYLIFIVGVDENKTIHTQLCSIFNTQILKGTRINELWTGRNSRGVTQFIGQALEDTLSRFDSSIDSEASVSFLEKLLDK